MSTIHISLSLLFFFLPLSQPGKPVLSILSPFTAFQVGEAIHFSCTAPSGPKFLNFHLYKKGVETPLVTQRADNGQRRMELTLSDVEVTHQGTYSCVNSDRRSSHPPLHMYHSNFIDIAVGMCPLFVSILL